MVATLLASGLAMALFAGDSAPLAGIANSRDGNYPLAPAQELVSRDGLPNFFAKLDRGEPVTIAYFGTSLTAAPGWRVMTFDWLKQRYPRSKLTMVSASLGGTGSIAGAFRADRDLLPSRPDLVFVEFAGNDNADARSQPMDVLRAMEGIVRKIRRASPATEICLIYAFGFGDFKTLRGGLAPRGATLHEQVASHYHLPAIHVSLEVVALEAAGKLINAAPPTPDGRTSDGKIIFTTDGSHPNDPLGYGIWAGIIERALVSLSGVGKPGAHPLPQPLLPDHWEHATTLPIVDHARFTGTWERLSAVNGPAVVRYGVSLYDAVPRIYRTVTAGSSLTLRFRGTHIGLKGVTGPDSAMISIKVDALSPAVDTQFNVYSKTFSYGGRPLPALPEEIHTVTWTLLPEQPDKLKILSSYNRKGNEQDLIDHPEKYAGRAFYVGEILLVGEMLPMESVP